MPLIKIGESDSPGKAMAEGIRAGLKVLTRKKKAKKEAYAPPEPSKIACPDCGKDQIEHSNGFVCACMVRKERAKA